MTIFAKLFALASAFMSSGAVRAVAFKYFIKAIILAAIPLCIFMGINLFVGQVMNWIVAKLAAFDAGEIPSAYQLTGTVGYVFVQLGLDQCLSLLLSAAGIRMTLKAIPFINL